MGAFDILNSAVSTYNESVMGELFEYEPKTDGIHLTGLRGVFAQPEATYVLEDFSRRQQTMMILVTSKAQWSVVPASAGYIFYGSTTYSIDKVSGVDDVGEPCYTLELSILT